MEELIMAVKIETDYGSIDKLRDLLKFKILVNKKKMNVLVDPASNDKSGDTIMLFYNQDNESLQMGSTTQVGYYRTGVQVACRHSKNQHARKMAYLAISYLKTQKNAMDGVFISIVNQSPKFTGIDETGNSVWVFDINLTSQE
jgi:hypothetical protein